jgi:predicted Zn-dependent protease
VKFSAAQLVRKAGECVDACQQELAVQFYRRALAMEPQNTTIMDALAELLAELQLEDEAKQLLEASCQLAPNSNPAKWMYLAQVTCDGSQALVCYQSGIKLLQAEMTGLQAAQASCVSVLLLPLVTQCLPLQNTEELATINNQLCAAFCAVAGLYMTDLW